jgi:hypothetical protein
MKRRHERSDERWREIVPLGFLHVYVGAIRLHYG